MDSFQQFNTGNRKKFLDQAKKKKQQTPSALMPPSNVDQKMVIKMQKNIRMFLEGRREGGIGWGIDREIGVGDLGAWLGGLAEGKGFLFGVGYGRAIGRAKAMVERNPTDKDSIAMLKCLGKFSDRISPIFNTLNPQTRIFFTQKILPHSPDFTLKFLTTSQTEQIHKIITSKLYTFIEILGTLPYCALVEELVYLVCSYPAVRVPRFPLVWEQQRQNLNQMLLNRAYENLTRAVQNKSVQQLGPYPAFLLLNLNHILATLHKTCQHQLLTLYKINPRFLQSDPDLLTQLLTQKPEYQSFLDHLNPYTSFNISLISYFIALPSFPASLEISPLIDTLLGVLPGEFGIGGAVDGDGLMACMRKISDWVKVHEICEDEDQQGFLVAMLGVIDRRLYEITDKEFVAFAKKQGEVLQRILKDKFIKIIYKVILNNKTNKTVQKISKICINLVEQFYNRIFRTGILTTQIFVNEVLSRKLATYSQAKMDTEIIRFVEKFPFVFSLKDRARKFHQILRNSHYQQMGQEYQDQEYHMGKIKIRRGWEFQDAFYYLNKRNIKKGFQISFIDQFGQEERGVDAGGLTKQFINRVLKAAFRPEFGMFVQNSQKQLLPHPQKAQIDSGLIADYYEFIGKMIGKALYEGITIGPKFCGPFLNAIIGKKNNFDDLNKIDKQLYNSLTYIKTMKQDASQLYLTFQFRDQTLHKSINLKKDGHKIKLTNKNKQQYISLLANYKVNKLLQYQSRHIRRGLKKVLNSEWLFMFNYEELNYLISGSGEIKVHELKMYTRYVGYTEQDLTIRMFWAVVMEFQEEEKSNLLMFVTACPRPSFLGFQELSPPFTIVRKEDVSALPVSHTCSNILELPNYKNKEILAQKLRLAINSGSGFQIA